MHAYLYALGAIALWATLATLGMALAHVPPFLLTGAALIIGSVPSWPLAWRDRQAWRVAPRTLALGIYGLFGFHFLLFMALRYAPAVEANLVNYLWPLAMVVLAPLLTPGAALRPWHGVAALMGFAGAAVAMLGASGPASAPGPTGPRWGFAMALGSAFIWASYSLWTQRVPRFATSAIGLFGLVSGVLALLCHALLEPATRLSARDMALLALCGLGPLGAAFYLWDRALKTGSAPQIAILSYLTPLASTALLMLATRRPLSGSLALAAALIVSAALLGAHARSA